MIASRSVDPSTFSSAAQGQKSTAPVSGWGKHGAKSRRGLRKLHLAVEVNCGDIIAHVVTTQDAGDASQVEPLVEQIDLPIGRFTADGTYDGEPTYRRYQPQCRRGGGNPAPRQCGGTATQRSLPSTKPAYRGDQR